MEFPSWGRNRYHESLGTTLAELRLTILMPVRDDWTAATELIRRLDQALAGIPCSAQVLAVDDLSATAWNPAPWGIGQRIQRV